MLCCLEAIAAMASSAAFRQFLTATIVQTPYTAVRWELPGVTEADSDRPFEFVLVNAPALERAVDTASFASHFRDDAEVVRFDNLGGDAKLVVPCLQGDSRHYGHLMAFLRGGNPSQVDELWRVTGETMLQRLGPQPVWLSTAGGGVAYLHVRLDDRPKYYVHAPYSRYPAGELE